MVKMTSDSSNMANQSRILTATLGVAIIIGAGFTRPSAAEERFLPTFNEPTSVFAPEETPEPTAQSACDLPTTLLGEQDVAEAGSVLIGIEDGWAEAHAAGSRVSYATVMAQAYPVVLNDQVKHFLDLFTGTRRDMMTLWVNRSGRYLSMVREVLRERGLPEELAFTAMIESGFKPDAVSRMGAKGMWQFMAATARRYGLRVDRWVDERLDPEKATVAAASYLRDLYAMFGSWPLAQAAYNAGEFKIARAINVTGSRDFWTLAQSRHLRRETKDFVPQIHAATMIGRDPDRYGFDFDDREPVAFDTLSVPAATDLRRLSATVGLPLEAMRSLNPTLIRAVTPPGRSWSLRVPAGHSERIMAVLAPVRPSVVAAAVRTTEVTRVSAVGGVHIVRPRDTVSGIAQRYGVSVNDVMRWNRLDSQDRIRPGERLRVSRSTFDR
jgi:membrane-bound lytic murein transglycosylase D